MSEQIILREYQETDRQALEDIIRETWKYDRFCCAKVAKKMAKVYLNSCLIEQTFTRVAVINHIPVGIIMGKNIQKHKCPLKLRIKWLKSIVSLFVSKEGRKISKIFGGVKGIDEELLADCDKEYKGEVVFLPLVKNVGERDWDVDYFRQLQIT